MKEPTYGVTANERLLSGVLRAGVPEAPELGDSEQHSFNRDEPGRTARSPRERQQCLQDGAAARRQPAGLNDREWPKSVRSPAAVDRPHTLQRIPGSLLG